MERYLVFARTEYDEPLEHRGEIEAENDEEARRITLREHGDDWLELSLVPRSRIHYAEREDEAEVEA